MNNTRIEKPCKCENIETWIEGRYYITGCKECGKHKTGATAEKSRDNWNKG